MRTIQVGRRALAICVAGGMLASCGAPASGFNPASSTRLSGSMVPHDTVSGDLLYVGGRDTIEIYTFPAGTYRESLHTTGSVSGLCADSKGNVFAVNQVSSSGTGYVYKYGHAGMKPIAKLDVPKNDMPIDCTADPTTRNLAVTLQNSRTYAPSIAIYPKETGTPQIYVSRALGANPQAGYDDRGNLFATSGGNVGAELAVGKSTFTTVTLSRTLGGVAHVQWDGAYLALQSFDSLKHNREKLFERIFRLQISGSAGKIVSALRFHGWPEKDPGESWIQAGKIIATPFREIAFWAYPTAGMPLKVLRRGRPGNAITVSVAP